MLRHRRQQYKEERAQSILEYAIVLGVVVGVIFAMTPLVKRGSQAMIKLVADQVGNQANADQQFDDSGYLKESYATSRVDSDKYTQDKLGVMTYNFEEVTTTVSNAHINLGFSPEN